MKRRLLAILLGIALLVSAMPSFATELALGLGLFVLLTVNSDEENLAVLIICFVLMGVLCYFAVEMLIRKSFRVFRKGWPGAIAVAVVLTLVCVGAKMDITGYEDRLPDREKIESVELNIYMEGSAVPPAYPRTPCH